MTFHKKLKSCHIVLCMIMTALFAFCSGNAYAEQQQRKVLVPMGDGRVDTLIIVRGREAVKISEEIHEAEKQAERESIFPAGSANLGYSHFTWGADIGASIDLRGFNMSTFDLDLVLGYKNQIFRTIGIGAGVHRGVNSGNTFIPIYALLRTSFRKKPSLFFLNLKAGYSFNTINDTGLRGGTNLSLGIGVNLAMSRRYQSHIILSYGYFIMDKEQQASAYMNVDHIDQAQIRFGITF